MEIKKNMYVQLNILVVSELGQGKKESNGSIIQPKQEKQKRKNIETSIHKMVKVPLIDMNMQRKNIHESLSFSVTLSELLSLIILEQEIKNKYNLHGK